MRCLLDKGVVRRATEGWIRQDVGKPLLAEQQQAITILTTCPFELCISAELYHILTHIVKAPFATRALDQVIVLWPTRYQKRWARRLRRLRDKYELDFPQIRREFTAMTENLRLPYSNAFLPIILTLEEFAA